MSSPPSPPAPLSPPSPSRYYSSSKTESTFEPKMYWVITYFTEDDRGLTHREVLERALCDIRNRKAVTWTPINPGQRPYMYPILVITLEDDLKELFTTAEIVVKNMIEEFVETWVLPFDMRDIFPPVDRSFEENNVQLF